MPWQIRIGTRQVAVRREIARILAKRLGTLNDRQPFKAEIVVYGCRARGACRCGIIFEQFGPIHGSIAVPFDRRLQLLQGLDRPIHRFGEYGLVKPRRRILRVEYLGQSELAKLRDRHVALSFPRNRPFRRNFEGASSTDQAPRQSRSAPCPPPDHRLESLQGRVQALALRKGIALDCRLEVRPRQFGLDLRKVHKPQHPVSVALHGICDDRCASCLLCALRITK